MERKTPFHDFHKVFDAKLVPFAGYIMPIQYKGVNFEHNHVRNHVGVFDVSHMAQILVSGVKAFDLVQYITTNDISNLVDGKVQYSCMLNENGGVLDDLLVYRFSANSYMLVVNAANTEKDFNWICSHNNMDVDIINVTQERGLLAVQGPTSSLLLQRFTDINLKNIPYYNFQVGQFAGCEGVVVSNTGYTGSGGFELYFKKEFAEIIWSKIFSTSEFVEPVGLAARDTLRLEMGYCLYGNDLSEEITPLEAGLSWIVKMNKNFIGKDVLIKQMENGLNRCLIGFVLEEKGVPRKDYEIFNINNVKIGIVTSGTMSPSLRKGLGMGYVIKSESNIDNFIFISIRGKKIKAKIVKRPFYEI
ncbi:MAG: glycine cleavage system protein T [Flavobacteriales bacterium]|nr:glycine cleavage system protein T [Flavobacteriales bacterium]